MTAAIALAGCSGTAKIVQTTQEKCYGVAQAGKVGQHLRDNEWLMAIKQRSAIPGGVCEFDLPAYHYWLHQDPGARRNDLTGWIDDISANWWFPLIVFTIAMLDSVIPIVPSETTVIAGGVAAGAGKQRREVIAHEIAVFAHGDNVNALIQRGERG